MIRLFSYGCFAFSAAVATYNLWGFDAATLVFAAFGCLWNLQRDQE